MLSCESRVPMAVSDEPPSATLTLEGHDVSLTHLDKVLYPATGFTKGQVIDYYRHVAEVMLPHVIDRPLTMRRFPRGANGPSFYERNAPRGAPEWVQRVTIPTQDGGSDDYCLVNNRATLAWLANLIAIEFHVPLWRVPKTGKLPGRPDHMMFDLDPGDGATILECCEVARYVRDALSDRGFSSVPKTSGKKGLHVYAPLAGRPTWDKVHNQAQQIAIELEQAHPGVIVSNMRKSLRRGKVLVDWSQNNSSKSSVAVYSMRAGPEPSVSTPVTWEEVARCAKRGDPNLLRFDPEHVLARVRRRGDLFATV